MSYPVGGSTSRDQEIDNVFEGETYQNPTIKQAEWILQNYILNPQKDARSIVRRSSTHRYIERDHVGGHNRLYTDYFSNKPLYNDDLYCQRFCMHRHVFLRIVEALENRSEFFTQRKDAVGNSGPSPLQKCTTTIRMLAYGISTDALDDYLRMGESTILECTKQFVKYVIECFGDEYMRMPNEEDLQRLLHYGDLREFSGANNDINIIDRYPLFNEVLEGRAPNVCFRVSDNRYDKGYYLTDGIYPNWAFFVKSISCPEFPCHKLFAKHLEYARNDVEQAFGVLQV